MLALIWRRGDYAVCRGCDFHLAGLRTPSACPECGRDLARPRAIVRGDRRGWPKTAAIALLGLGVISLGYAVFDDPAMDRRKPLWVLEVEYRILGSSRATRVLDEINRRIGAVPTDIDVRRELARIVLNASDSLDADPRWHLHCIRLIQQGAINRNSAADHAERMLTDFAERTRQEQQQLKDVASEYARLWFIPESAAKPLFDRVGRDLLEAIDQQDDGAIEEWAHGAARSVVSTWLEHNPDSITAETLTLVMGELPGLRLRAKPRVARGERVPLAIDLAPLYLAYADRMWAHTKIRDIRFNGKSVDRLYEGFSSGGVFGASSRGGSSQRTAYSIPFEPVLGTVQVEVDIEFKLALNEDAAEDLPPGRTFTRSDSFVVVPEPDPIDWVQPESDSEHRRVLESIRVVDAAYFFGESQMQSFRWHFPLQIMDCPYDIAHALWAEQDDTRCRIGNVVLQAGGNISMRLMGPRERWVRRDGKLINETTHPDPRRSVRMILEPDEALAQRQVETLRPWAGRIDLGAFEIREMQQWGEGFSSVDFVPPPSVAESD